jgi:hypothetical protein
MTTSLLKHKNKGTGFRVGSTLTKSLPGAIEPDWKPCTYILWRPGSSSPYKSISLLATTPSNQTLTRTQIRRRHQHQHHHHHSLPSHRLLHINPAPFENLSSRSAPGGILRRLLDRQIGWLPRRWTRWCLGWGRAEARVAA